MDLLFDVLTKTHHALWKHAMCVCVCAERKLCFFGWVEGRKCVLCERERANSYCNTKAIVFMFMTFFYSKNLEQTEGFSNILCTHVCASVCGGREGGTYWSRHDLSYILCVSCSFFQTCYILVCPNPLCECYIILCYVCECYIILCYVCECYMLIRTRPACICGAVYGAVLRMTICSCTT